MIVSFRFQNKVLEPLNWDLTRQPLKCGLGIKFYFILSICRDSNNIEVQKSQENVKIKRRNNSVESGLYRLHRKPGPGCSLQL